MDQAGEDSPTPLGIQRSLGEVPRQHLQVGTARTDTLEHWVLWLWLNIASRWVGSGPENLAIVGDHPLCWIPKDRHRHSLENLNIAWRSKPASPQKAASDRSRGFAGVVAIDACVCRFN